MTTASRFPDRESAVDWIDRQTPSVEPEPAAPDATARPRHAVLLSRLEAERGHYAEAAARTGIEECVISHSSKAHAFQAAAAHTIAVFYGAEAATAYMRDGTLPEAVAAPATPALDDVLRERMARAMAEAAGSKAFREQGREWDHLRSVWLGHTDAALAAVQGHREPSGDD